MDLARKLSSVVAPVAYLAKWKNQTSKAVAVEPLASEEAERALSFGDTVSLFSLEHNGYVSTDGYECLWPTSMRVFERSFSDSSSRVCHCW